MSETERRVERIRNMIERAFEEAARELEELERELERGARTRELYEDFREVIEDLEGALRRVRRGLREIREEAREEELRKRAEELERALEERARSFAQKYEELLRRAEKSVTERRGRFDVTPFVQMSQRLIRSIGREVEGALRAAEEREPSTVISSIRLREEELQVIDELVNAGIFKSRSEAVAFFTKRGIEASKDWLEKVRENIKRIRELQEEVRKEIERG
ncbi:MAG: S46 family peptidase [Acidilobaceae archaeon]